MNLKKQLEIEEGNIPHAYKDHLGYWTIGVGFMVDKRKGGKLLPEEIDFILNNRISILSKQVADKVKTFNSLNEPRQAVLINMAYQMGLDGLLGFTNTLAMLERGDFAGTAAGMLHSKWHNIDTPARAKRMSEQMRTGEWQT